MKRFVIALPYNCLIVSFHLFTDYAHFIQAAKDPDLNSNTRGCFLIMVSILTHFHLENWNRAYSTQFEQGAEGQ